MQVGLDDVAALNYTGGTTGMPKGCVHTQRDMIYTAATTGTCANGTTADDVMLNYHPVFWIAGENFGLIFPIFSGATVVLLARWDPAAWMAAVQRYRVTLGGMLVDNAVAIMDHPDVASHDLRSLRRTRVSSFVKKLNEGYRRRWQALTGSLMIEAAWGMTETHTCDTFTTGQQDGDFDLKSQPIFVGLPVPGTEFKITDFDTGALLPLGTEGEIVVRSPSQLKSYWNKPEATAASLRDGWFYTGDIGMLDEERVPALPGAAQGDAEGQRHERLPRRDRGAARPAPRHHRLRRDRPRGREAWAGAGRLRAHRPGGRADRGGAHRMVPAEHGDLQGARHPHRGLAADDGHRQGEERGTGEAAGVSV